MPEEHELDPGRGWRWTIRVAALGPLLLQFAVPGPRNSVWTMLAQYLEDSAILDSREILELVPVYWFAILAACWSLTATYGPIFFLVVASPHAFRPGWFNRVAGVAGALIFAMALAPPIANLNHLLRYQADRWTANLLTFGLLAYLLVAGVAALLSLDRRKKAGWVAGFGAFVALALALAWTCVTLAVVQTFLMGFIPAPMVAQFGLGWGCAVTIPVAWVLWWRAVVRQERKRQGPAIFTSESCRLEMGEPLQDRAAEARPS